MENLQVLINNVNDLNLQCEKELRDIGFDTPNDTIVVLSTNSIEFHYKEVKIGCGVRFYIASNEVESSRYEIQAPSVNCSLYNCNYTFIIKTIHEIIKNRWKLVLVADKMIPRYIIATKIVTDYWQIMKN